MKWLVIIILLIGFRGFAQDPQLFENIWYLEKLVMDGEDLIIPSNYEVNAIPLEVSPEGLITVVCTFIAGSIINVTNSTFETFGFAAGLIDCGLQVNADFQHIYFVDFFDWQIGNDIFNYNISTGTNDNLVLTLTKADGNLAIYGNVLLSIPEITSQTISIYPNPVKDILHIESNPSNEIQSVNLYNLLGELIIVKDGDLNQLNVSSLNSGVYILKMESSNGVVTKKIVKN